MSSLGPLDGRLRSWRCEACRIGHRKCAGGRPCKSCLRSGKPCEGPESNSKAVVFRFAKPSTSALMKTADTIKTTTTIKPALRLSGHWQDQCIDYFFDGFLRTNDLPWSDLHSHLHDLIRQSTVLEASVIAIGALHMARSPSRASPPSGVSYRQRALLANQTAVSALSTTIRVSPRANPQHHKKGAISSKENIWTTFFLGLFELMVEPSEANWETHFLHGTSALLRLRGPEACCANPDERSMFLTMRTFEVNRALIYNDRSFLYEAAWREMAEVLMRDVDIVQRGKLEVEGVMLGCSELCIDVLTESEMISVFPYPVSHTFAQREWQLRQSLQRCRIANVEHGGTERVWPRNSTGLLASIYYHATSIYLSGIFDHRLEHFSALVEVDLGVENKTGSFLPRLSAMAIDHHLVNILVLATQALRETQLMGLLLLYPLRVAAARARTDEQKTLIVELFRLVSTKGFVISSVFVHEINELWTSP